MSHLFKVLVDGASCHSGAYKWRKGRWTPKADPLCCSSGWHLTSDPLRWWKPKAELWLAEGEGVPNGDNSDKAAFVRARIVERVTKDWPLLVMFPRLRCFVAASERSVDSKCDVAWAYLSGANLSGAYLPTSPPAGWVPDADGRLERAK